MNEWMNENEYEYDTNMNMIIYNDDCYQIYQYIMISKNTEYSPTKLLFGVTSGGVT